MKKISICETAGWLKKWDRYLILTHKRPDGDTIGSASALAKCLRSLGKTACLYANTEITEKYAGFAEGLIAGVGYEYDKIISVDVASVSQFPLGTEDLEDKVDLAIDHHMSNTGFAK